MAPPSVQSQNSAASQRNATNKTAGKDKPIPDLTLRVRYQNTLPDIPFDPKFLAHPFVDLSRFVGYKQTSLEKTFKYDLLTEPDLGVKIDLINPETYASHGEVEPHATDARLLEDEPQNTTDTRRSQQHKRVLPWLRKTELMSSEINRYGVQTERQETKVGYKIKKQLQEQDQAYRSIQDQIEAIEKSFLEAQVPVTQHHSKRDVYAIEEMPFLPDFDLWKYPFAQVLFDSDPTPFDPSGRAQDMMCQALIRGMMDEEGEQYVAYFLPTDETLTKVDKKNNKREAGKSDGEKEKDDGEAGSSTAEKEQEPAADGDKEGETEKNENKSEAEEFEYKIAREYHWTVKAKASKGYEQENYFVTLRNGSASYNELETRVRLTRRRAGGALRSANQRLVVKYRPENENELGAQQHRVHMLYNPYDEVDVDEDAQQQLPQTEAVDSTLDTTAASDDAAQPMEQEQEPATAVLSSGSDSSDVEQVPAPAAPAPAASSPVRPVRPSAPKKSMPAMLRAKNKSKATVSSDSDDSSSDGDSPAPQREASGESESD